MSNEVLAAMVGASVGVSIAIVQAVLGYVERKRSKRDEYLFQAFRYFEGGTQKRNIGISVIEGLWQVAPHMKGMFIPLLVNQAIYLLTGSEQLEALNERDNLRRIMELLLGVAGPRDGFRSHYDELLRVLEKKRAGQIKTGISVEGEAIEEWSNRLTKRCS